MVDSKVIEAFHLMWNNFPEPVALIHKSREMIAVNASCEALGRVKGMKCSDYGAPEAHRSCLADQALNIQQATFKKLKSGEKEVISYWLPVDGYPELFVHFGVGTTIDYDAMSENIPSMK